jgi:hypothetical protein
MKKIVKMIAGVTLVTVVAGLLGGCYVESRPRYRPYYHHPVVIIR